jgi:short-subunit dehydrogenase
VNNEGDGMGMGKETAVIIGASSGIGAVLEKPRPLDFDFVVGGARSTAKGPYLHHVE